MSLGVKLWMFALGFAIPGTAVLALGVVGLMIPGREKGER